jgi:hypothetical protein
VSGGRKATHVVAKLGKDLLGPAPRPARDVVQTLQRSGERTHLLRDPLIEALDLLVEELNVGQQALEHEDVMLGDATEEGFLQLRLFSSQQPLRQPREFVGIALTGWPAAWPGRKRRGRRWPHRRA